MGEEARLKAEVQAGAIAQAPEDHRAKYRNENATQPGRTDLFVVSFPKSGRTWHRALVGRYLSQEIGWPADKAFHLDQMTKALGLKRAYYSHNGANFMDGLWPEDDLVASPTLWRGKPVTLLVRDPRDILVSAYHHAVFRSRLFDGSLSEFVRDRRAGIEKILTAYNRWSGARHLASGFRVVCYERMQEDAAAVLIDALTDLGMANTKPDLIAEAVASCRFEVMRAQEESGFYPQGFMRKTHDDPRAMKVREGRVGGHVDHLSADDIAFIDAVTHGLGNPFA